MKNKNKISYNTNEIIEKFFAKLKTNIPEKFLNHNQKEKNPWSIKYIKKSQKILWILKYCPYIRAVGVCNSVAMDIAHKSSDIDLLIITNKNHIWTARLFATIILHILGVRRYDEKISGRFCLSFFISDDNLNFSKIALKPKDPYLAFWLSSIIPIFGKDTFLKINKVNKKFINKNTNNNAIFVKHLKNIKNNNNFLQKILEMIIPNFIENIIKNKLLEKTLNSYSKLKNKKGVIINDKILKFHNNDKRDSFL